MSIRITNAYLGQAWFYTKGFQIGAVRNFVENHTKSIEIRSLQQMAQTKEEAAYEYLLMVQARFLKRYQIEEKEGG